jgi:hypothetical protein
VPVFWGGKNTKKIKITISGKNVDFLVNNWPADGIYFFVLLQP